MPHPTSKDAVAEVERNFSTFIDLAYPVEGQLIPRDHGYALYGGMSRCIQAVHNARWIGIHNIVGRLAAHDSSQLALDPPGTLRVRVPVEKLGVLLPLIGATLDINGYPVCVGAPTVQPLKPHADLDARLVHLELRHVLEKPFNRAAFDEHFKKEVHRQLIQLGIRHSSFELRGKSCITVVGRRLIGHAVRIYGLPAEDSLKLQIHGLGGKRTMGCGIFRAVRRPARAKLVVPQAA